MKKNLVLIAVVLAMAAVYVVFFTDWFQSTPIQISHTSRAVGRNRDSGEKPVLFGLDQEYELTEIKVVSLIEWQTNKNAQPLWHLASDGSDTIQHFSYGENINGMDPVVAGSRAKPLEPGVTYRIFITAGKARGQHDFTSGAAAIK
jgi:hypothetical protein